MPCWSLRLPPPIFSIKQDAFELVVTTGWSARLNGCKKEVTPPTGFADHHMSMSLLQNWSCLRASRLLWTQNRRLAFVLLLLCFRWRHRRSIPRKHPPWVPSHRSLDSPRPECMLQSSPAIYMQEPSEIGGFTGYTF